MTLELAKDSLDVGIVVADRDAVLAFYRDVIGLAHATTLRFPGGAVEMLSCGTSVLKLLALDDPPRDANPRSAFDGATGLRYITLFVTGLDEVEARCRAAGTTIQREPTEMRPGLRFMIVADPEGNAVELVHDATRA